MSGSNKVVWVEVRYVQSSDVPISVPVDMSPANVQIFVKQKLEALPPERRLGSTQRSAWEYKIKPEE